MSTRVDALRNTLDHLALDPKASEDRRYLVSMLRRLGYSDAEIEAQIGPLGEGPRVIEVEYEPAEGRAPQRPLSRETTFEVSAPDDGLSFRLSDDATPAGAGVEEVHHTDLSGVEADLGDWGDDYEQGPRDELASVDDAPDVGEAPADFDDLAWDDGGDAWDDGGFAFEAPEEDEVPRAEPTQELVEFRVVRRPDPAVAAGWQEVDGDAPAEELEATWEAPEAAEWEPEASDDAWAAPEAETGWADEGAPETGPAEQAWPETAPSDEDAWAEPEEELVPWPEAEGPEETPAEEAWPEAAEPEGQDPWPEATEPATEQAWEDAGSGESAWEDVEATDATAPYTHGDYTLYTREVHLSTGREQRIYFFAKNQPQSGEPCTLPDGYEVIENDKTGLPFLRRQR